MKIVFRVDASVEIGSGHVMRCLALADWLDNRDREICFVCRKIEGDLHEVIEQKGYQVELLDYVSFDQAEDANRTINQMFDQKIDLLIVDHYGIDYQWEEAVRPYVKKLFVIDDLANRRHVCDVLLDQNYYSNMTERYVGLVPDECRLLLGPQYLILRKEFFQVKGMKQNEDRRLFVFFGGSDPTDETTKVLKALERLSLTNLMVDVVVGSSNPKRVEIEKMAQQIGAHFYCQVDNMAELMAKADLSLGAGGVTMWERCFVGLPSVVTIVADNQRKSAEDAAKYGAIKLLGWHEDVTVETYMEVIPLINDRDQLIAMRDRGYELVGRKNRRTDVHPIAQIIDELTNK